MCLTRHTERQTYCKPGLEPTARSATGSPMNCVPPATAFDSGFAPARGSRPRRDGGSFCVLQRRLPYSPVRRRLSRAAQHAAADLARGRPRGWRTVTQCAGTGKSACSQCWFGANSCAAARHSFRNSIDHALRQWRRAVGVPYAPISPTITTAVQRSRQLPGHCFITGTRAEYADDGARFARATCWEATIRRQPRRAGQRS